MPAQISTEIVALREQAETAMIGYGATGASATAASPASPSNLAFPARTPPCCTTPSALLRPGDILVVDRLGGDRFACWSDGVTVAAKSAGAKAGVVDGPCTDLEEIEASVFLMWSRGFAPITTHPYDLGGRLNQPVCVDGAVVMPGDAVLCDDSFVLVLPPNEAEHDTRQAS